MNGPSDEPVINEQADRLLGRIIVRHAAALLVLLPVLTVVMIPVNMAGTRLFPDRRFLDTLSMAVLLAPLFSGTNKLFAERLRIGRELVASREWKQAIAALDPFAGGGQRFFDTTGEAHYLLYVAYEAVGQADRAEKSAQFLKRHRPGPWAEKIDNARQKA